MAYRTLRYFDGSECLIHMQCMLYYTAYYEQMIREFETYTNVHVYVQLYVYRYIHNRLTYIYTVYICKDSHCPEDLMFSLIRHFRLS